jgi:DNA-binding MarR family transcriptional regulator
MATDENTQRFQELYRRIYHRFHRRDVAEANRVSPESLAVLQHMRGAGPLTVMEAARHFERSQSAMSEIVSRLERRGVVERMADERDRRRTLVWLTQDGQQLLEKTEHVLSPKLLQYALQQLPDVAQRQLLESLQELMDTDKHEPGVKDD